MGELAEDFRIMDEVRKEHRNSVEPDRFNYAIKELEEAGAKVTPNDDGSKSLIVIKDNISVKFFPFTGWASGKGIKDGRGIHNLVNQLKKVGHG